MVSRVLLSYREIEPKLGIFGDLAVPTRPYLTCHAIFGVCRWMDIDA
jgi:hypothetical protein